MPDEPAAAPLAYLAPDDTEGYRDGSCVVVIRSAQDFARCLRDPEPGIEWLQVEGLIGDSDAWAVAAQGDIPIPLDVVLDDPAAEFSALYRLVDVSMVRSVRVTIPAKPGLMKALRLAISLQLPARILPGQPDAEALVELDEAVRFYLHDPMVECPVEFFHSLLARFRGMHTGTLWEFLEQNPAAISQEDSTRLASPLPDSVGGHLAHVIEEGGECSDCPWQAVCGGYFKWPDPDYSCDGVKRLFSSLKTAADEIAQDLAGENTTS